MLTHKDASGVVHEVVPEQDWTTEYYWACKPWNEGGTQLRLTDCKEGRVVTCMTCLGKR